MKKELRSGRPRVPHVSGEACSTPACPDLGLRLRNEESL
jgi:hypothetical protein